MTAAGPAVARLAGPLRRTLRSGSPRRRTCGQEEACACTVGTEAHSFQARPVNLGAAEVGAGLHQLVLANH
jgi:hypothetical protein